MIKKILILGYGYTAQHLTTLLLENTDSVSATTRTTNQQKATINSRVILIPFSLAAISDEINQASHILISTPPNQNGLDPAFALIKDLLVEHKAHIKWIGYLSATSVYGDHAGKWVTEDSNLNSPGESGTRRIKAEKSWLSIYADHGLPIHIFRLAGIYGPKRNNLVRILEGKHSSIVKKGHVFSRIHVDDINRALCESMNCPTPGEIYNLADDLPCAPEEMDALAASLLKKPTMTLIPYSQAELSQPMKAFYNACKRVSNQKFKRRFNFELRYPSYKEGLLAIHKQLELHHEVEPGSIAED
jgi:nucleoside-diphosphate-sugar epimerase